MYIFWLNVIFCGCFSWVEVWWGNAEFSTFVIALSSPSRPNVSSSSSTFSENPDYVGIVTIIIILLLCFLEFSPLFLFRQCSLFLFNTQINKLIRYWLYLLLNRNSFTLKVGGVKPLLQQYFSSFVLVYCIFANSGSEILRIKNERKPWMKGLKVCGGIEVLGWTYIICEISPDLKNVLWSNVFCPSIIQGRSTNVPIYSSSNIFTLKII